MNRTSYLIIYLFAFIGIQSVNAQVPGYAGKRFSVNAEMDMTPALYKINYNTDQHLDLLDFPNLGVHLTTCVGMEYVLSKKTVAGVNYKFNSLKTPIMAVFGEPVYNDYDPVYNAYFGDGKIKNNYWGFYFKFYRYSSRGTIAPIGRFHQLELITGKGRLETGDYVVTDYGVYSENVNDFSYMYNYGDIVLLKETVEEVGIETEVKQMYLKYAYGQETVWFDKLIVSMSVQGTLALSSYFNAMYEADKNGGIGYAEYAEDVRVRSYGGVGFTINIGLGYFVF